MLLDHGASGHGLAHAWWIGPALAEAGTRSLSGVCWDAMIGGNAVAWGGGASRFHADTFRQRILRWGIGPDRLRRRLRPEVFGDALEEALALVEAPFAAWDGDPRIHAADHYRENRMRFQAGAVSWIHAFFAWPVQVFDDRRIIEASRLLHPEHVDGRALQSAMVVRSLPRVARQPLDRNAWDTTPLLPGPGSRLAARWRRRGRRRGVER